MLLYILEYALFIRTREIHLRCENYRRDAVLSQKPPKRFRVRLNAVGSGNDEHRVVKHLQGALGLGGKIHCPGVSSRHSSTLSVLSCACFENIVMPLARSSSWLSSEVFLWSTLPNLRMLPQV